MSHDSEFANSARNLIARAWADPEFKLDLIQNPKKHLAEAGLLEEGVLNNDDLVVTIYEGPQKPPFDVPFPNFWIPPKPALGSIVIDAAMEAAVKGLMRNCSAIPHSPMTTCCCDITVAPRLF